MFNKLLLLLFVPVDCYQSPSSAFYEDCGSEQDEDDEETVSYGSYGYDKPNYSEPNLIYFVLDYNYDKKTLSFAGLKGRDSQLARLLQSCSFLDVHLAVVKHSAWKQLDDPDEQADHSFDIIDWIDSQENRIDLANLKVDFNSQIIGDFSKLLNPFDEPDKEDETPLEDCERIMMINRKYYQFLLVAWPKCETADIYLRYNFYAFLLLIERRVSMISGKAQFSDSRSSRSAAIEDLRKILVFYAKTSHNPAQESLKWNNGIVSRTTLRLLKLCTRLEAKNEGLAVLNLLAKEEGISDDQVAAAIAEFQCNVAGMIIFFLLFRIS